MDVSKMMRSLILLAEKFVHLLLAEVVLFMDDTWWQDQDRQVVDRQARFDLLYFGPSLS
jgi:hypothetical protein